MDEQLKRAIIQIKAKYEVEGFIILGIFGSRARGDFKENSDIDILYRITEKFSQKYPGLEALGRLEEIREEISIYLNIPVDVANVELLNKVGRKYILPEAVYVA